MCFVELICVFRRRIYDYRGKRPIVGYQFHFISYWAIANWALSVFTSHTRRTSRMNFFWMDRTCVGTWQSFKKKKKNQSEPDKWKIIKTGFVFNFISLRPFRISISITLLKLWTRFCRLSINGYEFVSFVRTHFTHWTRYTYRSIRQVRAKCMYFT